MALLIAIDQTAWAQYEKTGDWSGLERVLIQRFGPSAATAVATETAASEAETNTRAR